MKTIGRHLNETGWHNNVVFITIACNMEYLYVCMFVCTFSV